MVDSSLCLVVHFSSLELITRGSSLWFQEADLAQYRKKVASLTLKEKNDFRNQWHKQYFKGNLFDTVQAIRKEEGF